MKFSLLKTAVACAAAAVVSPQLALAQSAWNVANGAFDNPANWNPNGVPGAGDDAVINNGGTATFNTPTLDVNSLTIASVGGSSGTLAVTGGDLFGNGIRIGENGTGTATVNNAILRAGGSGSLFVGGQDGTGTGTLTISGGPATRVTSGDDIGVGRVGTGTLNVQGGEVQGGYTFIGKYGTGTWNHSGGLFRQSFGDIEIGDGGRPDQIDNPGPRTGIINITGGVLQVADHFAIGNRSGTGTVSISGGILAATGGNADGNIYVGRGMNWEGEPAGSGGPVSLRVTGDDSTIIADGGFFMNTANVAVSSTLIAEITGTTHTTIRVTGDADISNGKLAVDLTGYTPVSGNSWTILTAGADITADKAAVDTVVAGAGFDPLVHSEGGIAGSLIGQFASTDFSLAPLTPGLTWNVSYANNSVTLSVTGTATFTADFDDNGQVNSADLAKWKLDFGVNANSDANGDGKSDGTDFLIWQRQFGSGVPASAAIGAVPEPASIALIGLAATAVVACGRSRRNQA
jgi:hypothetical protein